MNMQMDISNRVGRFVIQGKLLDTDQEFVRSVMANCIILRCEHFAHNHTYEYYALSHKFDEKIQAEEMPEYEVREVVIQEFPSFLRHVGFYRVRDKIDTDAQKLRKIATKIEGAA